VNYLHIDVNINSCRCPTASPQRAAPSPQQFPFMVDFWNVVAINKRAHTTAFSLRHPLLRQTSSLATDSNRYRSALWIWCQRIRNK